MPIDHTVHGGIIRVYIQVPEVNVFVVFWVVTPSSLVGGY
jgi:hypothetical protein